MKNRIQLIIQLIAVVLVQGKTLPQSDGSFTIGLVQHDGQSSDIAIIRPEFAQNHCGAMWGFLTDSPKKLIECENCCPFPKLGFALDEDRPFSRITKIDHQEQHYQPAVAFIRAQFNLTEIETMKKISHLYPEGKTPLDPFAEEVRCVGD